MMSQYLQILMTDPQVFLILSKSAFIYGYIFSDVNFFDTDLTLCFITFPSGSP